MNLPPVVTRWLRLGHRNGGLALSFSMLAFVLTGVMLNHSVGLGLAEHEVPAAVAKRYYSADEVTGYEVDGAWYYALGDALYRDRLAVATCASVNGVVQVISGEIAALCDNEIVLLMPDGTLIERLGQAHGLPAAVSRIAIGTAGELVLVDGSRQRALDTLALSITGYEGGYTVPEARAVPAAMTLSGTVSWEQFIVDLHSGRYFGQPGVWLWDAIAVLIGLLAVTGIVLSMLPKPPVPPRRPPRP